MTERESSPSAGDASASPALRYVVLYHDGIAEPHFDLMIESRPGGPLYTFRCGENPLTRHVTDATRLSNHRRHYLDYEGPVSRGRGHVKRVAEGRGSFDRDGRRAWLWRPTGEARCAQYRVRPAGAAAGRRRWMIEGK